jgi:hypothetical protein
VQARLRGHRFKTAGFAIPLGALAALGQGQESKGAGGEARSRRGLAIISQIQNHKFPVALRGKKITHKKFERLGQKVGNNCARSGHKPNRLLTVGERGWTYEKPFALGRSIDRAGCGTSDGS